MDERAIIEQEGEGDLGRCDELAVETDTEPFGMVFGLKGAPLPRDPMYPERPREELLQLLTIEIGSIVELLKDKRIFVIGATGFIAKIFVEKVLRVQPKVKKLFLLVRAGDAKLAAKHMENEVFAKELFDVLKEKHGLDFDSFISKTVYSVAGDIMYENLGIEDYNLREMLWEEIDIVVNVAATTKFYERYDFSLNINTLGAKHVLEFAKQCTKVKMLLHVSKGYVAGVKEGIISEKPFHFGEALNKDLYLYIEGELRLVKDRKKELHEQNSTIEAKKIVMKELGIQRARMYGWPNTYVFTKAMGEMLLGHLRGDMPLVIMRPTIITIFFDDSNLECLRKAMVNNDEMKLFDFDPMHIEWDDYLINIHIPGVIKYLLK
ncbi:fatty acyl-CoA reductase 8-like [Dendrobium catenatum]|uniref:fatty acyl-CoA reductase 8-like n=1 Tax=Dendrobium catenatum TaxID=906689 RepID=UPI00109FAB77|nr:fatty acyl-CoA reductase 8-like [Dendrobium catenatum]